MRTVIALSAVLLLTAVAYRHVPSHPFVYEDLHHDGVVFWPDHGTQWWRFLEPKHVIAEALWVDDPKMMHTESLYGHLLNGVGVFLLARLIGWPLPWLVAGIFLLHPLNSETVAYASARSQVFLGWHALVCLLVASLPQTRVSGLIILLYGWLAMQCHESGVALAGIVPLVWWYQHRLRPHHWLYVLPLGALAALGVRFLTVFDPQGSTITYAQWWRWEALAVWRYAAMVVWPVGLSVDHHVGHLPVWGGTLAVIALVVVAGGVFWMLVERIAPRFVFVVAWAILCIAPRFAWRNPLSTLTEHSLYLAMIGVSFGLAAVFDGLLKGGSDAYTGQNLSRVLQGARRDVFDEVL